MLLNKMACTLLKANGRFRETFGFHVQGRNMSQVRN
jgi:hypothetical protein